jgi:hypothetical protein
LTTLDGTVSLDYTTAVPDASPAGPPTREVRYEYSPGFAPILSGLRTSLLVSTYQAGKLVTVGVRDGGLAFSFPNFERAMGVAVRHDRLAIGSRAQVWFLDAAPALVS